MNNCYSLIHFRIAWFLSPLLLTLFLYSSLANYLSFNYISYTNYCCYNESIINFFISILLMRLAPHTRISTAIFFNLFLIINNIFNYWFWLNIELVRPNSKFISRFDSYDYMRIAPHILKFITRFYALFLLV